MSYPSPVADWYPDPAEPATAARWWDGHAWTPHRRPLARKGPALDRAQADLQARSPQPWGWRPVVLSVGALIGLIVVGLVASATVDPQGAARIAYTATAGIGLEALLALAVWQAGRGIAARNGGWPVAFGLRRPRWSDAKWVAAGIGITFVTEAVVVTVANALTHGRASKEAQNLQVSHVNVPTIVVLVAVVVFVAPFIEEIVFRGLLLRTFMRRLTFWPAAALSTSIFAVLHTYEVSTLEGALTLAGSVSCLGLTNCWLNRRTDSLAPGMIVHALFNLLAVVVLIAHAQ